MRWCRRARRSCRDLLVHDLAIQLVGEGIALRITLPSGHSIVAAVRRNCCACASVSQRRSATPIGKRAPRRRSARRHRVARHAGGLEQAALARAQAVQLRLDHAPHVVRHAEVDAARRQCSAASPGRCRGSSRATACGRRSPRMNSGVAAGVGVDQHAPARRKIVAGKAPREIACRRPPRRGPAAAARRTAAAPAQRPHGTAPERCSRDGELGGPVGADHQQARRLATLGQQASRSTVDGSLQCRSSSTSTSVRSAVNASTSAASSRGMRSAPTPSSDCRKRVRRPPRRSTRASGRATWGAVRRISLTSGSTSAGAPNVPAASSTGR